MRACGIRVHVRPLTKLRNLLVRPKDPTPPVEQAGVIYKLHCDTCESNYVGETGRKLIVRAKEHRCRDGPMRRHLRENGHTVDPSKAKVLDREHQWLRRGIKEAIHIHLEKPDLNQDQGRYSLSPLSKSILSRGPRVNPQGSRVDTTPPTDDR